MLLYFLSRRICIFIYSLAQLDLKILTLYSCVQVLKEECQEDEEMTTDLDVSDLKTSQEEENFESALNDPVCFDQTLHVGETAEDDTKRDNKSTLETESLESNSEEPVTHIEDVPAPCICYGQDSGNYCPSPEQAKENGDERAEEKCVDLEVVAQQPELWSSTFEQETHLPSIEQEKRDQAIDELVSSIQDSDLDTGNAQAGEVIDDIAAVELSSVKMDTRSSQFNKQEVEMESNGLDQGPDGGYSGSDSVSQEEEKKNEGDMAEEECADSQQAEISSSTLEQETKLPSTQEALLTGGSDAVGDGLTGEAIEEVVDEDRLNKLHIDNHSPQFGKKEVENERRRENNVDRQDGAFYEGAAKAEEKMMITVNIVACTEEVDGSSVAPPCSSASTMVDNRNDGLTGITSDADFPGLSLGPQPQKEDIIAPCPDEDTDATIPCWQIPSHETENLPEISKNGQTEVSSEEFSDQVHVAPSVQMIDNGVFDKASVAADSDAVGTVNASVTPCAHLPSSCQDQQSDCKEHDETFDGTSVNSAADAAPCNNTNLTAPLMSEEISQLEMSSSQAQQRDHMKNNEYYSAVPTDAAPVTVKDSSLPLCQIYSPSFEQSEQKDSAISSPGFGEESGISSMAVSPDLQYAGNEFDMDFGLQSEGWTGAQNSLFADDAAVSFTHGNTAGMVFRPYPSRQSQEPLTNWTKYESFAANEDVFGHEIEEIYHREMDQFAAEIAASVTSYTDELKIQTELKPVIEVVEIKEKKARVTVEKKEDSKAEKEKEEDYEKTEISIMEATMDHNEWITESNYQVPPWMNLSASSSAQDQTKTSQLPTEECQYSSPVTDTASTDTIETPSSTEVKQTSTLSLTEENPETNKKVVAVQPMPQNVNVTFRVHYSTQSPYQTVAVTGNQQELGNWKGFIPLERAKDGNWATVVSLPTESHVEWKFVLLDKGEVCRWEECGNRLLDTGFGDDLLVHKWWGLL